MAVPLRRPAAPASTATGPVAAVQRRLQVVPARRRVAWFAVGLTLLVSLVMMGALIFHTQLASRQLAIDELDRGVRTAQSDFDVLRAERAELRSPTRIAALATELGMGPGSESEFVAVDPWLLARTIAQTGVIPTTDDSGGIEVRLEPLDQFRLVKRVVGEAP